MDELFIKQENKISNFYNNIISIMAILIAAFSIIGFNIGGIKFIVANQETLNIYAYVVSIVVLNVSIVVSLLFLCLFLRWFVIPKNREKDKKNNGM